MGKNYARGKEGSLLLRGLISTSKQQWREGGFHSTLQHQVQRARLVLEHSQLKQWEQRSLDEQETLSGAGTMVRLSQKSHCLGPQLWEMLLRENA